MKTTAQSPCEEDRASSDSFEIRLTVEGPCLTAYEAVWSSSNVKASPERSLHTLTLMLSPAADVRSLLTRQEQRVAAKAVTILHKIPRDYRGLLPGGSAGMLTLPHSQYPRDRRIVQGSGGEQDIRVFGAGVVAGTLESFERRQAPSARSTRVATVRLLYTQLQSWIVSPEAAYTVI